MLPFSIDEFFDVFRRYNEAIWPAQIVPAALAVAGIGLTMRRRQGDLWTVSVILAALWLWMAAAYHLAFFRTINPAAWLFGAVFALESLLLVRFAMGAKRAFSPRAVNARPRWEAPIAVALVTYALVGYPLIGWAMGHRYPASPTFGVPCPTTIYTLGILLWWGPAVRWWLLAIPVAWAAVGASAALQLGVPEDWGLPAAAVLAISAAVLRRHRDPAPVALPGPAR